MNTQNVDRVLNGERNVMVFFYDFRCPDWPRLHRGLSRGLRQAAAERLLRVGERGAV